MRTGRFTAWLTAVVMLVAMMPGLSYAEETAGNALDGGSAGNDLIIVYNEDADCTQKLQEEPIDQITGSGGETSDTLQELAQECSDAVADQTGEEVTSGEFLAGSIGEDGAVLSVSLEEDADIDEAMDAISQDPDVAYVQPNYEYQLFDEPEGDATGTDDATEGDATGTDDATEGDATGTDDATESYAAGTGDATESSTLAQPNDPYCSSQYSLNSWVVGGNSKCGASLYAAWNEVVRHGTVTVAVLDTGVQTDHPDLYSNLDLANASYVKSSTSSTDEEQDDSSGLEDRYGHGTHVAGIIAAVANNEIGLAGASYNAKVLPINIFYGSSTNTEILIRAYEYLKSRIDEGELTDLHVINLSLGGYQASSKDDALEAAIKDLREDYNVVTVCAGGNGDSAGTAYTTKVIPGDFDECVCVTALDECGNNTKYSDYNEYKDISAPGDEIYSTWIGGSYEYNSGTSMAAPLVSGILALLWTQEPELTVDEAVEAIESTTYPVNTAKYARGSATGSKGAVDAAAAVRYVKYGSSGVGKSLPLFKKVTSLNYTTTTYNGSLKKPAVTVTGLTKGTDFTVKYTNNKKVGTATATITGTGKYSGTITKTYKIKPRKTAIKDLKKYKKAFKVKWKKRTTQVSGYQIQYSLKKSMKNAKTKTVKSASVTSKKITGLKSKKKYYVRVRTYKTVSGVKYYSAWSSKKTVRTK